jgi:hypothetical protein
MIKEFPAQKTLRISELKKSGYETAMPLNLALYVEPGDRMPVHFVVNSPWIKADRQTLYLEASRRIYVTMVLNEDIEIKKMSPEDLKAALSRAMLYVSADGREWVPAYNVKAVRKIFGVTGGRFSSGLSLTAERGLEANILIEAN